MCKCLALVCLSWDSSEAAPHWSVTVLPHHCQSRGTKPEHSNTQSLGDLSALVHVEGSVWVSVFCISGTRQGRGVVGLWAGGDIITTAVAAR